MNTTNHDIAGGSRSRKLLTAVRDELIERREARAANRALKRDLGWYHTQADVDDILAMLPEGPDRDADKIRGILAWNLEHQRRGPLAS